MERRHVWAWRKARLRRMVRPTGQTLQAAAYDSAFPRDVDAVTYHYAVKNDHLPDFDHPRWVNEKIRWQFLHHDNPLMTLAADKVAVRDYLRFKGAEIRAPELFAVVSTGEELIEARLPERFVLKSTFGYAQNHFVTDPDGAERRRLAGQLPIWSAWDHWRMMGELHYRGIPKRWLAEELIGEVSKIREYKFYCLHGQPIFVLYITGRVEDGYQHALFDMNWQPLDFHYKGHPNPTAELPPRPRAFEQLVAEAKRLSEDFMHVRVDFLEADGRLFFSELTFSGGAARNPFLPYVKNEILGEMIDLGRAGEYLERGRAITSLLQQRRVAA
jgi:hypothetical protein